MALMFMDSFDHYATADIFEKWTVAVSGSPVIGAYGRNSTNGMRLTGDCIAMTCYNGVSTVIASAAMKISGAAYSGPLVVFGSANQWEACLYLNDDYTLRLAVATNVSANPSSSTYWGLLGSASASALNTGTWYYIETKLVCHGSTGSLVVRVNGVEWLNVTGQDTVFSSTAITRFSLAAPSIRDIDVDDCVALDNTGSLNNDFLGDVTISAIYPNGAGATTGWTPSAGSNYDCCNEAQVNDDTDYVSTATNTTKDLYDFTNAPAGADIRAVQLCIAARKAAEGPGQITPVVRSNSVDYDQTAQGIGGTSYSFLRTVLETDPNTSAAWGEAAFNAAQFGFKKTG